MLLSPIANQKFRTYFSTTYVLFVALFSIHLNAQSDEYRPNHATYPIVHTPKTVEEIRHYIEWAASKNKKIRIIGTAHSTASKYLKYSSDQINISLSDWKNMSEPYLEEGEMRIDVDPGVTYIELADFLAKRNLGLGFATPLCNVLNVVGAMATGSHGDSIIHPSVANSNLRGMTFVDGSGQLQNIDDPTELTGISVHLGLIGVVTKIKLKVEADFGLRVQTKYVTGNDDFSQEFLSAFTQRCDFAKMHIFPNERSEILMCGKITSDLPGIGLVRNVILNPNVNALATFAARMFWSVSFSNPALSADYERFGWNYLKNNSPFQEKTKTNKGFNWKPSNDVTGRSFDAMATDLNPNMWSIPEVNYEIAVPFSRAANAIRFVQDEAIRKKLYFPAGGISIRFSQKTRLNQNGHLGALDEQEDGEPMIIFDFVIPKFKRDSRMQAETRANYIQLVNSLITDWLGEPHLGKNTEATMRLYGSLPRGQTKLHRICEASKKFDPKQIFSSGFYGKIVCMSD